MNKNASRSIHFSYAISLALACGLLFSPAYCADAQVNPVAKKAAPASKKKKPEEKKDTSAIGSLLREAYLALGKADHDYHGHRIKAMDHTAAAARLLGETLGGDGAGREAQKTSDDELREADGILVRAQLLAGSHRRNKVMERISTAIREIAIALKIR